MAQKLKPRKVLVLPLNSGQNETLYTNTVELSLTLVKLFLAVAWSRF